VHAVHVSVFALPTRNQPLLSLMLAIGVFNVALPATDVQFASFKLMPLGM
jgi:hypothetical protein